MAPEQCYLGRAVDQPVNCRSRRRISPAAAFGFRSLVLLLVLLAFPLVRGMLTEEVLREAESRVLPLLKKSPINLSFFNSSPFSAAQHVVERLLKARLKQVLPQIKSSEFHFITGNTWIDYIFPRLTSDCFMIRPTDTYTWEQLTNRVPNGVSPTHRKELFDRLAVGAERELKDSPIDLVAFERAQAPEDALQRLCEKLSPVLERVMEREWTAKERDEISVKQAFLGVKPVLDGPAIFVHSGAIPVGQIFGIFVEPSWLKVSPGSGRSGETGSGDDETELDLLAVLAELRDYVADCVKGQKIDFADFAQISDPAEAYEALKLRVRGMVAQKRQEWGAFAKEKLSADVSTDFVLGGTDPKKLFTNSSTKRATEISGWRARHGWDEIMPTGSTIARSAAASSFTAGSYVLCASVISLFKAIAFE
ncbi:hypothetical protein BESB_067860 [Besnoitia besnoiti]|uniref:Transmembrane protein n=1 Tax=Besnoitia besnoiti TaxID=94643 RepID=A0A2A9MGH6_BESBE|nr:hypothetical protein BESB_067860 [Besnoitia besnoiti]PFH34753.1 hypothetical protein BESB_067860 [Besnoitia besnoiti]